MMKFRLRRRHLGALLSVLILTITYVFLFAPLVVVVGASFDPGPGIGIHFPPRGLSGRAYRLIDREMWDALMLSLRLGVLTALVSVVLGTMAAFGIVRGRLLGQNDLVDTLFRAPLQIPHVVTGIALLQLYYVLADQMQLHVVGSFGGLLIGHILLTTPYVIGTVGVALQRFNPRLEEAAFTLGSSQWTALRRVTLPMILPGIYAGGLYAFIVSFGDVPVSLFLSGSGATTLPVNLFYSMEFDLKPAILAISTLILAGSFLLLVALQRLFGLDTNKSAT